MGKFLFWLLKIFGWKIDESAPIHVKKAIVVVGPHTSNWDFIIGKIAFMKYNINARFLVKKELFFFPLGYIMRWFGAIPVDRKKKNNMTVQVVDLFGKHDEFYVVFTPEGTRKYQPNWKKGFYYIAMEAKVPILIAYMDYKKKIGGFHSVFEPTGNVDGDIKQIKNILADYTGKIPENGIRKED